MRYPVFFVIVVLCSCQAKNQEIHPTFSSSLISYWKEEKVASVWDRVPKEEIIELTQGWEFHNWDTLKGKEPIFTDLENGTLVNLPHRIKIPNSNIWYSGDFELENGVLAVQGDDGQQIWIEGIPILPDQDHAYQIPKTKGKITIRVINNAVAGGLTKVNWIPIEIWENAKMESQEKIQQKIIEAKSNLWQGEEGVDDNFTDYPIWFSDPVILPHDDDHYLIRWTGEKGHESWLFYGKDSVDLHFSTLATEKEGTYSAYLPKMKVQYYRFEMSATQSPVYSINLKESEAKTSFALWADSQGGWEKFENILHQINLANPDFTIGVGDLVGNGRLESDYQKLLQYLSPIAVPHYLFPGNHDYDGSYQSWIPEAFQKILKTDNQKNYFSWQSGPCAFIGLDPNENFPVSVTEDSDQHIWFQKEIKSDKWTNATWKIILVHQPPFSQGWQRYQGEKSIENLLRPVWESGLADLVVSGHTHDYERLILNHRKGKTAFLILGGAGGGMESDDIKEAYPKMDVLIRKHHFGWIEADNKKLDFKAIGLSGEVIDSFSLEK